MDTTLRDGEQTQGVSFSANEKVNIARALLQSLKVDRIEVASACVSDGEQQAVAKICDWASEEGLVDRIEILGFVDYKRSVDWIKKAGGSVINLLAKGSEKHCREQLGRDLTSHIDDISRTVEYALERQLRVNMYLEDWSSGFSESRDYVYGLVSGTQDLGISHYLLPDTLGLFSPQEVFDSLKEMKEQFPNEEFDFHPHNDYGLATANVIAAIEAGIDNIHCTVNCLGERAGNASLAEVAVVIRDKLGIDLSIDETQITLVSRMVENFSGKWIAANTPVVGADVFTQTAGIHADGDMKGNLYVSRLTPERFDRKRSYALGKMSGKASLVNNLEELGISLSEEDQAKVLQRVVALGDSKHLITAEDLPFIIADVMESKEYQYVDLIKCDINTGLNRGSSVSLTLTVDGEDFEGDGTGNGGFDAFMDAVTKILSRIGFVMPLLKDYEVHIPRGGKTDALTECIITWQSQEQEFKTRGVDSNQVMAAVKATTRMINMKMHAAP
ncbi:MAG: 2-isopropylmalate synthase [Gammaproteobacteria bacterium]|nr:2-isopropylmalate synthase [Gammaproteobacteria bacterium]|tara:strand:- start:3585 stop:5087 length:1503 start_codon:yes stop_codon:yes gene_type:complete